MISGMIERVGSELRSTVLDSLNERAAMKVCGGLPRDRIPSFIVVTPELVHLAPLAARNNGARVQPVFVANGATADDVAWLRAMAPSVPVIRLWTSVRRKAGSLLHHGDVIEYVARASSRPFCIQDADCFVTDSAFWETLALDVEREYAVGPFSRKPEAGRPEFPETFLLMLNAPLMERLRRESGITAVAAAKLPPRARNALAAAGYPAGKYLETRKQYFDTLQQFWVAAMHDGFGFRLVEGDGESVHHVGGTSYLHRTFDDLAHWDFWPLNVHYFHLRLLELPACSAFRPRFQSLFEFHGSSRSLLGKYPEYASGRRRAESDRIIDRTSAASLYERVVA
jgi:hypothetical protein